jgi:transposase
LRYPSDLTDDEWACVEPLIPPARRGGGKRRVDMRAVMNGVMYILSTGCQWRYIPKDFPPRSTLHDYFTWWHCDGTLDRIHHALYVECREKAEREASPTACIIDSQSVKSAEKMLWGERRGQCHHRRSSESMERPMPQLNDLSRSLAILEQDATLIAVIEMGQSSWLVAGIVPGIERSPLKKLAVDENALLKLLRRWREEAEQSGHRIKRIAVAFEAGRDGFWLARWLRAHGIEAHVIHASSVAVSREHRRAKTDRLDTELLKRAFLGWLRGERDHCKMVAIPTLAQEDAKRPNRERESLIGEQSRIVNRMKAALARLGIRSFNPKLKRAVERLDGLRTPEGEPIPPNTLAELKHDMERRRLVRSQIQDIERTRLVRLEQAPGDGPHAMVRLLTRVIGVGVETADMLVQEVLSRNLRDRRAVARYGGLTGSPDESGKKRREKGLARSGNARVRRGMIQLAWRFLMFQKDSALAHWFYTRTKNAPQTRKTMIVALARKLLIALWRLVREGTIPEGFVLRPAL